MTERTDRTTQTHEWYQDLLGAYALGALLPDEAAALKAHLASCPTCPEELRHLRFAVQSEALVAEERSPSPDLRDRLWAAIAPQADALPVAPVPIPSVPGIPRPRLATITTLPTWSKLAAVLTVILIGSLLAWNISLRGENEETRGQVVGQFAATADAPNQTLGGDIRYLNDENLLVLEMHNLPALAEGEVYQLWLVRGEAVLPSVTFTPSETAEDPTLVAVVFDPQRLDALAITREPGPLGSISATTPIIMIAQV